MMQRLDLEIEDEPRPEVTHSARNRDGIWMVQPAPRRKQELLELLDLRKTIDRLEARPWLEEGVE